MKKKLLVIVSLTVLALVLASCGDSDDVSNPPANNDTNGTENNATEDNTTKDNTSTNTEDGTDNSSQMGNNNDDATNNTDAAYLFTSFDLEADFESTEDAVEVDYDQENDGTEANYNDQIQGIQLAGDEAMQELDSIFSEFGFDENTPNEEVLTEVFEAFNIPEDATNVELDIDFNNGTEKEYKQ